MSRWVELIRAVTIVGLTVAAAGCTDVEGVEEELNGLVVLPRDIALESGVTQQFTAYTVTPAGDAVIASVMWSASGGTIDESGLFVAGNDEGEFSVLARARAANSVSASSSVRVQHPLSELVISPPTAVLEPSEEQRFGAFGLRGGDSVAVGVTYTSTGGEIFADGLYRAGDVPGVYQVTATEQVEDDSVKTGNRPARAATAEITVEDLSVLDRLVLLPPSAQLAPAETQQFTVYGVTVGGDSVGVDVDYSASGGTVTAEGLYEAGSAAGDYLVIATESTGAAADTSGIVVSVDPLTVEELILLPASAVLYMGEEQQYTALGRLNNGDTVETDATFSASGGAVSPDGRYVAGAVAGDYEVVATRVGDGLADTAAVTVEPIPVTEVVISPASATLVPGDTVRLTAQARDSAGNDLSGRTPSWSSSAAAVATVNENGRVTAADIGSATITATIEEVVGTASITVDPPPVASVTVVPDSVSVYEGEYVQLAATLRDARGNELTGRTVDWLSDEVTVATVDGTGRVDAVAPGTAVVTATSEGVDGTAAITVDPVPVASVTVAPDSVSMLEGEYVQLTATLRDAAGNELTDRTVDWSSDQVTVATVDGSGRVDAVARGTAVVTAISEGVSGSANVTVTPGGIALAVQRLSGGSGVVLVSNGIPLAPGALQPGDVGDAEVWVEGQEQAVYVEALEGWHPDGSVRAILVQFNYDLPDMMPKSGQLVLGTTRATTDLSKTTPPSVPSAVALPSSPDYLVTTLLAGELLTEANSTTTPEIQAQSDDYDPAAEAQWAQWGDAALRGGAQYEHPHTAYSHWLRSGDVTWWDRATRMAVSYRDNAMNDPSTWPTSCWRRAALIRTSWVDCGSKRGS